MTVVTLFEKNMQKEERQSSKGNQLKWLAESEDWYKADYTGYEGLAEYMVSHLLALSSLNEQEYILYETETIRYRHQTYLGCVSKNFLPNGWKLMTLERLFQTQYGKSLNQCIYSLEGISERIQFLVNQTIRITGLKKFGVYMSQLLTLDAFFLNEDRHTHNIAVLMDEKEEFRYCPIFDNGSSLLSDTTLDYPMDIDIRTLMSEVEPKTFCRDFDKQLDAVEQLYGQQLIFRFSKKDVRKLLDSEKNYPPNIKERIYDIIVKQMAKYAYLFSI